MGHNYQKLTNIFEKVTYLSDASSILSWDANVLMPTSSAPYRANQLAAIEEATNRIIQDPNNLELIKGAQDENLNKIERANLREIEYQVKSSLAVAPSLLAEFEKLRLGTEVTWRKAKSENNFSLVEKELDELFKLSMQIAEAKANALNTSVYQAMINEFDRGIDEQDFTNLFTEILNKIPQIVKTAQNNSSSVVLSMPIADQKILVEKLSRKLGFNGKIDQSIHPFCGGNAYDPRLTVFYLENNLMQTILAAVHETGHGLYEQNRPLDLIGQPVSRARGMAMHESQSLFMEKQIGSSRSFCTWLSKFIDQILPNYKFKADDFYQQVNNVKPSLIRVFADEVTYPLHVAIRYMIEKKLVDGEIKISDLPEVWDQMYEQYLGIIPTKQSDGCLQDIHWYMGAFGYFPSYTAGAVISSMIAAKIRAKIVDFDKLIENGEFEQITNWLKLNIHQKASIFSLKELNDDLFGAKLDFNCYYQYLQTKFA
jgi:carboxypeptidase Taq